MDEKVKNLVIVVLGSLCLILLIGTVSSCSSAYRQKIARDREMAGRLDLEEKMNKFTQEKLALEEKVKSRDKELVGNSAELVAAKKELIEEQMITRSLKEDLSKLSKIKEALEEELKQCGGGQE